MTEELEILRIISERLSAAALPFMLTGSFALTYYGRPRMTRDLDFVVALKAMDASTLTNVFAADFYIDEDALSDAIRSQRMFNLMHLRRQSRWILLCARTLPTAHWNSRDGSLLILQACRPGLSAARISSYRNSPGRWIPARRCRFAMWAHYWMLLSTGVICDSGRAVLAL